MPQYPLNPLVGSSTEPSSVVSWQSAFWALVPIALNSMTQPCGMPFGFRMASAFALRSSPILCACDAIWALLCTLWHTVTLRSLRAAVALVTARRFRDPDQSKQAGIAGLQQSLLFRVIVFALGALPQIVKLYGMQGVQLTRIVGILYLTSFSVLELLTFLGQYWKDYRPISVTNVTHFRPRLDSLEYKLGLWTICASVLGSGYLTVCATIGVAHRFEGEWIFTVGLFIINGLGLKAVMWGKFEVSPLEFLSGYLALIGCTLITYFCMPLIAAVRSQKHEVYSYLRLLAIPILVFGILILLIQNRHKINEDNLTRKTSKTTNWMFLFWQFVSALLFYMFTFDSTGTIKPGWTDQLG